jgi:hypothetical protein
MAVAQQPGHQEAPPSTLDRAGGNSLPMSRRWAEATGARDSQLGHAFRWKWDQRAK